MSLTLQHRAYVRWMTHSKYLWAKKIHVTHVNDSRDSVMSLTLQHRAYF